MVSTKKDNKKKSGKKNKDWRQFMWLFLMILMGISIISTYLHEPKAPTELDFSLFINELDKGSIKEVQVRPSERLIIGETAEGNRFKTFYIDYPNFINDLREKGVSIKINPSDSGWVWGIFVQALLPFLLIIGLWFFIFRQAQGVNNQAFSFGKSKTSTWKKDPSSKTVSFKDVAGIDEAVEEVKEIVDFLKSPKKYQTIGAKIPKGVLLMGPPGTGKTLLAKAIAGEANVPFFSLSGSDFVEMFVGVGASRVRDLFAQAKKSQPAIIFVDELDAVGRHRGAGMGGGHDEREQTLNQLLVEMDGFDPQATIIIIAATNRPDILDPALLRPGRFDRQVVVDKPDVKGREQILEIHSKNKKMENTVNLEIIAKRTPGFTGADLSNLVNEAALLAARFNKSKISLAEFEEATDRVMAGPERKSKLLSNKEKEIVAYHELGHAIVALELPQADPVHKVSILPRGMALGYTLQLPVEDKHLISRSEIEDQIRILMGGRIAEDIIFNSITSGASNDIERATDLASKYVCLYGMSEQLGARKYGKQNDYVFLGKDYQDHKKDYSETTAARIDEEILAIVTRCYADAKTILETNKDKMITLAKLLIEKEVIEGDEFKQLYLSA